MIQRIQSIYLALASILILLMTVMPVWTFKTNAGDVYHLLYSGLYVVSRQKSTFYSFAYPFTIGISISALISIISIFLYKKRTLQMNLCIMAIIFLILLVVLEIYYIITLKIQLNASFVYHIAALFPVISIILIVLAHKGIKKDDELVKSADRIR